MKRHLLAGMACLALSAPAGAQTLRIAMAAEPTSADPQHYAAAPNSTLHDHVFESLVDLDARLKAGPSLATGWSRRDDRTWVFDLRQGVRFHNGQPFTARDVHSSVPMGGWAASAEETLPFFRIWVATLNRDRGVGTSNSSGWSDPDFDASAVAALTTMDDAERSRLLQAASRRALEQMPILTIHFESAVWAFRRGLTFGGRMNQTTMAQEIRPE